MKFLLLAGIHNSGPNHWQTKWHSEDSRNVKLDHSSWDRPDCLVWVEELNSYLTQSKEKIVLVAHSLACLMVAHWANQSHLKIQGALLVSVPDPKGKSFPADARNFGQIPMTRFDFPSIVVSSQNDPYCTSEHMNKCAKAWGSQFKQVGFLGHINADSGLSNWPEGKLILNELTQV
jgi:uncharacterized protein